MSKEIYISSTPHETRLAIVEDEALTEIYYERENEYTLAGSIYNGRVTRVLPGMQSSFVDVGLERDAFLYITDFMEETPDPEEFDTTSPADRPPRLNGGERQDEAGPARSSDRGDRGRGRRGGRDRDRNQDRPGGAEPSARQPGAEHETQDRTPAEATGASPFSPGDSADAGEGAPGADGGRRWRGRRGRRRGRGPGGESVAPTPGTTAGYSELESSSEDEPYTEIDAPAPQPSETPFASTSESPRGDRSRDAGRRGQREQARGNQRFDSPRRDRDQHSQRAPGDFYGADSGEVSSGTGPIANAYPVAGAEAGPEPLILPGESLSKYRKGEDAPTPAQSAATATPSAASVQLAPPANLYTVAAGWDGGDTLPGETLSRRRPADSRSHSEASTDSRSAPRRNFDQGPRRDARSDSHARDSRDSRDTRPDRRFTPPAAATPVAREPVNPFTPAAGVAGEPVAPSVDQAPDHAPGNQAPEVAQASPFVPDAPPAAAAPEAAEYEPTEASASHRVDPLPVSEYRQGAPTLDAPDASAAPAPPAQEAAAEVAAEPSAPAAEAHDITSINATGEMLSEPVEIVPDLPTHPAPMKVPEPASPIRHEGAVVLADAAAEFPAPGVGITGIAEIASGRGGFAPVSGPLAEEVFEEEDSDGATLQASSIEEMEEDLEEETLEGAADLGTMLREMSIDHITRTSPEIEEEDDSEQDDLEEDDLEEEDEEDDLEEQEEESHEEFETDDRAGSEEDGQSEDEFQEQEAQAARSGSAGQGGLENRSQAGEGQPAGTQPRRSGFDRDADRKGGRRDGRRDGRRGRSDRPGDRGHSGHSGGHGRHSVQSINLPAISDLLKPGQEILVQIAKEPIAKKGARITSHIALPGRFLVFMPTVNHTGVSRKIESDGERRRLKEILLSEKGDASGGFIVRTAAEGASEEELRSDLRFLLNLWADIKTRSDSSKSPALIYHDLNLIERILRDQVTDNFSAIWVDTESEYERVLRFLQRFQPSLIRRVKLYLKDTPLFEQFGITEEINKALRSKVWLKSGGSIVINQTEALVAIDINTGKFVGKTARLEDTIVKTNLDAIPEIVRQIRLRDLGGIIIIDFIDMDERKNRNRVMAALEDELKSDRAPSKVLQFNDFGLVAITRKRVKQSLERTLSTTCAICTGTGMVKSPVTVCNDIYIEMRKMHKLLDRGDVMLRVNPEVVKQLKSSGAKWLQEMEEMVGKTILVKSDPALHPEQFDIH
jgi:ribonuclease G